MPLAFIDHEASSLTRRSFPIEVGWVFEDGTGESHLIRPAAGWREWSMASQAVHGITQGKLKREGKPPKAVARRALEALAGCTIVADQPAWDAAWFNMLLETAGLPPASMASLADIELEACRPLLALLAPEGSPKRIETVNLARNMAAGAINGARDAEQRRPRVHHRALPDAESNWRIWVGVRERVAAALLRATPGTAPG